MDQNYNNQEDDTRTHTVLTKGTMVSHYRIVEKIGAGGMGEVYLAEDTELDRKVALKFLSSYLCQDEDCRARFKREAQAAAKLDHPNIVTVYEVGEYQGRPFFAMQHIEGQSLKDCAAGKETTIEEIVELGIQLSEGLQAAHDSGVIHRDIKPSNILIDVQGRARIVDFGLASVVGKDQLTKTGSTLGTIGYMSPEQVQGQDIDHRSDLFSLGVVLYELITKQNPFMRDTEAATLKALVDDAPEPLARFKREVPESLELIVSKLLDKQPELRYQSGADVVSDLKRLAAVKPAAGKPVDWWNRYVVVGAVIVLIVMAVLWMTGELKIFSDIAPSGTERKMLAVLPFVNLGQPEDEYFADGITDEITSRLAMVHGLGIISRTSAYVYKNSEKTLPQIAKELGVDYILEGTIRWDKTGDTDRVRITPQLIRVADDLHMWAGNFEKAKTGIFDVQIDIATRIVDTLGVTLLTSERQSMEYRPTNDFGAYDLYLRGKEYWDKRNYELAIPLLERAVGVDPEFSRAYSLLARLHGFLYFNLLDHNESRYRNCEEAAQKAMETSNGGVEGHIGMGYYYYYCKTDYDHALEEFKKVLQQQPNNSDVLMAIGFVQRRQGRWREAADNLGKAAKVNPHSLGLVEDLVITLACLHESREIIRVLDRSLSLAPDAANLLFLKASAMLELNEDTAKVREVLNQAIRYGEPDMVGVWMEGFDILFRDYESAIGQQTETGDYILSDSVSFYLTKGDAYHYWGKDSLSRIYYDSARMVAEGWVALTPDEPFALSSLALAHAGLGRKDMAIREGQKAAEALPISKDALYGTGIMESLATIYLMTGEYDLAINQLDSLVQIPSGISIYDLNHHPRWDPIRDNPRFQALIAKYERKYGI